MERCDLVDCQVTVLNRVKEFRVGSAAGAEWFHGQRMAAGLAQVMEEQSGQQGLAHAGVGTSDEDDARQTSSFHDRELTTEQTA
jgi:hypothetical protein